MAHRRVPLPSKICECGCGLSFIPYRDWQRFYSPAHRADYYWRTHEVITKPPDPIPLLPEPALSENEKIAP